MRHGNMERHFMVTRRDPGMETCLFSSLLVVGAGLVISPYRTPRAPVVCFIASFTVRVALKPWPMPFHGRVVPRTLKAAAVYTLFVPVSGL